ncbi:MAG TPA: bifunctional diaminohydroxyphosphoribosylaminopyrimidine deaminase/5-amino-6-(5-phosphoribosylamino)uracil reductase RibD [Mycobacteriales bacterium]|nr:bifunctional diaminohydroxyphosphoribosylaminopyrimidine deaminase/5-amino-6-(5-phosphoribosylamino)uracil reductase RibD [Mycobacteriales bacterium]
MASATEIAAMRRALALADAAPWQGHPNPTVGAVVLDPSGAVVGTGVSAPRGGPHAEVVALAEAGPAAAGGTVVVTLEPCAARGRTPACTEALVAAGVRRVVHAAADPQPPFGGGAARLREAQVCVEGGVLAAEARAGAALAGWLTAVAAGRPVVTWKSATTLDGRTAAVDGSSRWITDSAARSDAHALRSRHDAVLVGIGTVLADDPELTVRDAPGPQPLRVVADPHGRTPRTARVLGPGSLVAVGSGCEAVGEGVVKVDEGPGGLDPLSLLEALAARGVRSVLLEGGARLAGSFVRAGLVDRAVIYLAPALLGAGTPVLGDVGIATMSDAQRWRFEDVSVVGCDLRVIARPLRDG